MFEHPRRGGHNFAQKWKDEISSSDSVGLTHLKQNVCVNVGALRILCDPPEVHYLPEKIEIIVGHSRHNLLKILKNTVHLYKHFGIESVKIL